MRFPAPLRPIALVFVLTTCGASLARAQDVLTSSAWDAERKTGGTPQKGAFRIVNGSIYHLDQPQPVGEASLDANGNLNLAFLGHRKYSSGRAVVAKAGKGVWKGSILMANGTEWPFVIRRR